MHKILAPMTAVALALAAGAASAAEWTGTITENPTRRKDRGQ
jgi:hypothetical protein